MGDSDFRGEVKVPYLEERRGLEESMECGEERSEDPHTGECQPLLKQPQEDTGTKMKSWDEQERWRGR